MTYKLCKALIEAGKMSKAELKEKIDVYFAAGRITKTQYKQLIELLK